MAVRWLKMKKGGDIMRWEKEKLYLGKKREVEKFLWFPKEINKEVRWLEKAKWEESYCFGFDGNAWYPSHWLN